MAQIYLITFVGSKNYETAQNKLKNIPPSKLSVVRFQTSKTDYTQHVGYFIATFWKSVVFSRLSRTGTLRSLLINFRELFRQSKRMQTIERSITSKHLHAIQAFLHSSEELYTILEDDFVPLRLHNGEFPNSFELPQEILEEVSKGTPLYYDLCASGGLGLDEVGIIKTERNFVEFCPPRVNTCCGYIINREFAKIIYDEIFKYNYLSLLPVDWMLNVIIKKSDRRGLAVRCLRPANYHFLHGSFSGYTKSWQDE